MGRPRSFDDETVIERAMEAFWTHGYGATTPAMLAEATGTGKGSLYHAFTSKRALFDRCLDAYHARITELSEALLERPGSTRACIEGALRAVVDDDLAQPTRRGCLIGNTAVELAGADPELAARLRGMQDATTSRFAARIERGRAEGDVPRDRDAGALAEHFANTLAGLRVTAMTHEAPSLHRIIDTAMLVL